MTPFNAPTANPNEPVTTGAPVGPGAGPEALTGQQTMDAEDLDRLKRYLPALVEMAARPDSTSSFRNYVRVLRSKVT